MCRELGFPCPRSRHCPVRLAQAREFARPVGYPLIAKLATPWAKGSGLRSTSVVRNQQELDRYLRGLRPSLATG